MIRLYCLAQGMKNMSKDEVNALVKGNDYYTRLIKVLPWVLPRKSRYDMYQCMMLSGIEPRHFRDKHQDVPPKHTLVRIRNYHTSPDAYVVEGHQTMTDEDYIQSAQMFWWNILSPLQTGPFMYEEPDPIVKMYWVQQKARSNAMLLIKASLVLNPEWRQAIDLIQSHPEISHVDCLLNYSSSKYPDITKGNWYRWFGMYETYYTTADKVLGLYAHDTSKTMELYYKHQAEYDEMYSFLFDCCMFGYANDEMMEGDWLYEH